MVAVCSETSCFFPGLAHCWPWRYKGIWKEILAGNACWWLWIYLERNSESLTKTFDKFLCVIILYLRATILM